jgi:nucleotide-binding universal stress UspA family protein
MTTFVVGIDGSETAAKAAERAGEYARATSGRVHVVCAYTARRAATVVQVGSDHFDVSELTTAEQIAEQQAAAFRAAGIEATSAVGDGKPATVILEEAERVDADVIVVGNRRMQGVTRVLGAVANEVVHHAPCDVLVVKTV